MAEDIRRVKTKENIRNTFIDLLADHEFEKVTVKMITYRARINKSTFYRNYSDKYALFDNILNQLLKEFTRDLKPNFFELISNGSTISVGKAIKPIIIFFSQHERTLLILQTCRLSSVLFENMAKALENTLIKGITTNNFPAKNLYCTLIANNILTTIKWWHLGNHHMSEAKLIKTITTSINKGIIPSITN